MFDQIWWTRRIRIQTEKRLLSNARHSQVLLLWYSFFTVALAVYHLTALPGLNDLNVMWVVFSILVLVMSGYIQGLSYTERAALVKLCYENLQALLLKANGVNDDAKEKLQKEYQEILDSCENHTVDDFYEAICVEYLTSSDKSKLTKRPTPYIWACFLAIRFRHYLLILFLYSLPIAILAALELTF